MKPNVGQLAMNVVDAACILRDVDPDEAPEAFTRLEGAVDAFREALRRQGVSRSELERSER